MPYLLKLITVYRMPSGKQSKRIRREERARREELLRRPVHATIDKMLEEAAHEVLGVHPDDLTHDELESINRNEDGVLDEIRQVVGARIQKEVAPPPMSPAQWEVLAVLADEWNGTFEELYRAAIGL